MKIKNMEQFNAKARRKSKCRFATEVTEDTEKDKTGVSELMRWNTRRNPLTQVLSLRLCAFALNTLIFLCDLCALCGENRLFFVSPYLCARHGPAITGWFCTAVSKMSRMGK